MIVAMLNAVSLLSAFFLGCFATSLGKSSLHNQTRSANTCADPSLTTLYVQAFSPSYKAHLLSPTWFFVVVDSAGSDWQIQADAFPAWETPQEFTVPFYQLNNPTTGGWIYLPAVDDTPPSAASGGFVLQSIRGYAYSAQVCGSVPLYAAFNPAVGDHWYTTDEAQHGTLVANGWEDAGVPFFVLPLSTTS